MKINQPAFHNAIVSSVSISVDIWFRVHAGTTLRATCVSTATRYGATIAENLEPPQDPGLVCDDFRYNPEGEKETNAGEYAALTVVHACEFCLL